MSDGHVELENVSFRYEEDRPLIENLSLDVKPGQRIAIVGPTGCGKTTLINLLMRFYDVNGGKIEVSGKQYRYPYGNPYSGGICPDDGRKNQLYRGTSSVNHSGSRCDTGDERRTYHRTGRSRFPDGTERILCTAV